MSSDKGQMGFNSVFEGSVGLFFFYVLLTVHLIIISVINQLIAQILVL